MNSQNTANILIVEDDNDIRELLKVQLESVGYQVSAVEDGERASDLLEHGQVKYNLYLIDRMLPGIGGIELCKKIRSDQEKAETPIVMVTALTQSENIIEGLDAGADDYITKPFDMNILLARVRAQLRRVSAGKEEEKLDFGDLIIEPEKCRISYQGSEISLTQTEYKILTIMAKKPGHVFTRSQLIGNIQGDSIFVTNRTIDTHIAGLRKKMGEASNYVETIRGIGYRFKDNAE